MFIASNSSSQKLPGGERQLGWTFALSILDVLLNARYTHAHPRAAKRTIPKTRPLSRLIISHSCLVWAVPPPRAWESKTRKAITVSLAFPVLDKPGIAAPGGFLELERVRTKANVPGADISIFEDLVFPGKALHECAKTAIHYIHEDGPL